jgi:crotonobetainyl-CoA:carnitine CoA-transferase CaiB-like acyl-CoA transferase
VIAVASNFWRAFCDALSAPELIHDPRFASLAARQQNQEALDALLEERLRARPAGAWEALLTARGVPVGKVNTIREAMLQPQAVARGMLASFADPGGRTVGVAASPLRFAGGAPLPQHPPSAKGADSAAILRDLLGYAPDRIAALRDAGVIGGDVSGGMGA